MRQIAKENDAEVSSMFEVTWAPFQLNPRASERSVDKRKLYDEKFGKERVEKMIPYMKKVGAADGISFSYGGTTSNTLQSHRIAEWILESKGASAQNVFMEGMFKRYFEQEKSPNDYDVISAAAEEAGMDKRECAAMLEDKDKSPSAKQVSNKIRDLAQQYNVTGVPHFIIGKHSFSGAQDVSTMKSVLSRSLSAM